MIQGINYNCFRGNKHIPESYVVHADWERSYQDDLWMLKCQTDIQRVRTMIWLAERDNVATPWLHVPLQTEEAKRIRDFANLSPIPVELVIGPLWEARWLDSADYPDTGPIPDNPYKSVDELFVALQNSLWRILFTPEGKPALPRGTRIDIWNEFAIEDTQEPILAMFYPWARSACRSAGVDSTVSILIDVDGNPQRAFDAMTWIANLGCGLPDVIEVHINAVPDFNAIQVAAAISTLRKSWNVPVLIGEDDLFGTRTPKAIATILNAEPLEWISWRQ